MFVGIWGRGESRGRLTGHQEVESITNGTLVAEEVDAAILLRLLLLLFSLTDFRTEGDATTKDNVGVIHLPVGLDSFFVRVIRVFINVEVCSRTHLADVSREGTLCVLRTGMGVFEVKVVREDILFRARAVRI